VTPEEAAERDAIALALDILICLASSAFPEEPGPVLVEKTRQHRGSDTPLWKEVAA
jgi:hypothetical protein